MHQIIIKQNGQVLFLLLLLLLHALSVTVNNINKIIPKIEIFKWTFYAEQNQSSPNNITRVKKKNRKFIKTIFLFFNFDCLFEMLNYPFYTCETYDVWWTMQFLFNILQTFVKFNKKMKHEKKNNNKYSSSDKRQKIIFVSVNINGLKIVLSKHACRRRNENSLCILLLLLCWFDRWAPPIWNILQL